MSWPSRAMTPTRVMMRRSVTTYDVVSHLRNGQTLQRRTTRTATTPIAIRPQRLSGAVRHDRREVGRDRRGEEQHQRGDDHLLPVRTHRHDDLFAVAEELRGYACHAGHRASHGRSPHVNHVSGGQRARPRRRPRRRACPARRRRPPVRSSSRHRAGRRSRHGRAWRTRAVVGAQPGRLRVAAAARQARTAGARSRSTARSTRVAVDASDPASASDVAAGTGSSSARSETLSPIPTTAASPASSTRIPPSLRLAADRATSLGHLRRDVELAPAG